MVRARAGIAGTSLLCAVVLGLPDGALAAGDQPPSPSKVLKSLKATGPVGFGYNQRGAAEPGDDRTLAPYFYVAGGDPEKERLPLEQTRAEVDIAGVIARVVVHQVFKNGGKSPIEAVYVFPASTRAAVHAMRMKIGQRTVEARIERKQEARAQYEQARAQGKRASLLEQNRPNVFTTSVANIMPGDRIEVELEYTELIVPEESVYEFVYPTVVGPRYAGGTNPRTDSRVGGGGLRPPEAIAGGRGNPSRVPTDSWMSNPHLQEGEKEPYGFGIEVHLQTGIPIKDLTSPSHKVKVDWEGQSGARVTLAQSGGGNKDFILRYRLAGDRIESGALVYQQPATAGRNGERFFALMMEPPRRPELADVPPREYVFLLDVSGSMHGFPLDTAKSLMRNLLGHLRPTDHFNVALFSGANYVWSPSGSRLATANNIREAVDLIENQHGGGGTELMGGLQGAYAIPPVGHGVSRTVVVVTDGYVGVEAQAFRFIRDRLDQANLFAFGIGTSVNRALIEGMARAGLGAPFVVLRPDKAAEEAEKLRRMIDRPVLTDIEVRWRGLDVYDVSPEKVPDLLAERPLLVFGKLQGDRPGTVEISGRSGRGAFSRTIEINPADSRPQNAALRALWARKWVATLEDELPMGGGKEVETAITNLGLSYSLLTPFTSFVAVDSEVVNRGGQGDSVRQALPMPEGVSNLAVGGAAPPMAPASSAPGAMVAPMRRAPAVKGGRVMHEMADESGAASTAQPMEAKRKSRGDADAMGGGERVAGKDEKASEKPGEKPAEKPAVTCRVVVSAAASEHLGDISALGRSLEQLIAAGGCPGTGALKLRLTIDAAGRIVKVERLAGDAGLAAAVGRKLDRRTTPARVSGAPSGTVEVSISLGS